MKCCKEGYCTEACEHWFVKNWKNYDGTPLAICELKQNHSEWHQGQIFEEEKDENKFVKWNHQEPKPKWEFIKNG